jgi:hypothetical protein
MTKPAMEPYGEVNHPRGFPWPSWVQGWKDGEIFSRPAGGEWSCFRQKDPEGCPDHSGCKDGCTDAHHGCGQAVARLGHRKKEHWEKHAKRTADKVFAGKKERHGKSPSGMEH